MQKTAKQVPVIGHVYAVHTGTYAGQMLLYITRESVDYCFLSIPEMRNFTIPQTIFDHGVKTGIVKYVETLPKYVIKVAVAQYSQNSKTKQSVSRIEE